MSCDSQSASGPVRDNAGRGVSQRHSPHDMDIKMRYQVNHKCERSTKRGVPKKHGSFLPCTINSDKVADASWMCALAGCVVIIALDTIKAFLARKQGMKPTIEPTDLD